MPIPAGTRLGPYEVVGALGAGGMGEVYRARDPRLGRDVAIKLLTDLPYPDRQRRFEQEARAVASLSHPNVLSIFDVGAGEVPFLVTELLEGETVRQLLERGPLPVQRTVDLALQFVSGLGAAHERGIIHRDLKPENLFITRDGRLKILDFGLAKVLESPPDPGATMTSARTMPGTMLGTIGYMAPEQVRGLNADHRSDIFAFGAIVFEMLTGRRAFHGDSAADTIAAVLHDRPSDLDFGAGAPASVVRLIQRCLQKNADDRFQSARDLASALESLSDERSGSARLAAASPGEHTSIAVLPFLNLSADPDNQYFSDGLAEDLISALARLTGLRVASPTSSFRFRSRDADIRQIGRELGVEALVEGSVRRSGGRLRITTRLIDALNGTQLWSERYDRELTDLFDIQDEIVESIVKAIAPTLVPAARTTAHRGTRSLDAYELYLKGRYFWNQRSPGVLPSAIQCFEEAIALDAEYALPYAGLADCYSILHVYGWMPPDHCRSRAHDGVTRALTLEPGLAEAHLSKALYTFHFERHWRDARQHFLDALAARPRMAAAEAQFGVFLATAYEHEESRERIGRALEIDPHASAIHFLAASAACLTGDMEAAERHAARALELQPESLGARWPQTVALLATDRIPEAIAAAERVIARSRAPIFLGVLAMVYGRAGRISDARRLAQELDERKSRGEYILPGARVSVQLGIGDATGVRDALAECLAIGSAPMSVVAANRFLLDGYRQDAEIAALLDELHDGARPVAESRSS